MESASGVSQVPDHVLGYLGEQKALTLATATGGGEPHAATYLYVNDGVDLFIWLKPSSRTAENVKSNPRVGFAIDEYASDLRQTKGVQGTGQAAAIGGEEIARVASLFGDKFPELSPGATLSITFFRIEPSELEFIDNTKDGGEPAEGEFGAEFHREHVGG
jgi:uncharacterized protein YhbP (UPF0306 family)